jgi:hypothetical protein
VEAGYEILGVANSPEKTGKIPSGNLKVCN